jgi:hypothetical protein
MHQILVLKAIMIYFITSLGGSVLSAVIKAVEHGARVRIIERGTVIYKSLFVNTPYKGKI